MLGECIKSFGCPKNTLVTSTLKCEAAAYLVHLQLPWMTFSQVEERFGDPELEDHTGTVTVIAGDDKQGWGWLYRFEGRQCGKGDQAMVRIDIYRTRLNTQDDNRPGG